MTNYSGPVVSSVYVAPRSLEAFHRSGAFVRGIKGPIGSGKSVACVNEIVRRACEQAPDAQGRRLTRWAIIRNTYGELKATTIKTWQEWVPERYCPVVFDSPIRGNLRGKLPDGTLLDAEILFFPLDNESDVRKLLSLDLTGAWINEAREVRQSVVNGVTSRVGRFPAKRVAPHTWSGVIMDTNPPDDEHWWYRYAEEGAWAVDLAPAVAAAGRWEFFNQPGALIRAEDGNWMFNPGAENVEHQPLGAQYWIRQMAGKDPEWIATMLGGEYGSTFDGRPVYQGHYNDAVHYSREPLEVYSGRPLWIGMDFGLTPAAVIGQVSPRGQRRILRAVRLEDGGLQQFCETILWPLLHSDFPGVSVRGVICDPAGGQRSQVDEATCIGDLIRMGLPAVAAPTNDFGVRREAVLKCLGRLVDGQPGLVIDPGASELRRGFMGGYCFRRLRAVGSADKYQDKPDKNEFSHIHDALQYFCLGVDESVGLTQPRTPALRDNRRGWAGFV